MSSSVKRIRTEHPMPSETLLALVQKKNMDYTEYLTAAENRECMLVSRAARLFAFTHHFALKLQPFPSLGTEDEIYARIAPNIQKAKSSMTEEMTRKVARFAAGELICARNKGCNQFMGRADLPRDIFLRGSAAWMVLDAEGDKMINEGGYKKVYFAIDLRTGQRTIVCITTVGGDYAKDTARAMRNEERYLFELRNLPGIIKTFFITYAQRQEKRQQLIFLEYYNAGDLRPLLALKAFSQYNINREWRLKLIRNIFQGLANCHAKGIRHSDLKFGNVVLKIENEQANAAIIDFGIAFRPKPNQGIVEYGGFEFSAPEIFYRPDLSPTFAQDIWAAGMIAASLLQGSFCWLYELDFDKRQSLFENLQADKDLFPEPPKDKIVDHVLWSCFRSDPAKRCTAAQALARLSQNDAT